MRDHFFDKSLDEEWKNLYEKILRKINRARESHSRIYVYSPEFTRRQIENDGMLKALTRLLPLAAELQSDKSLHCLMPWQHHGVLDLRLVDWAKQKTYAFLSVLPKEDAYLIRLFPTVTDHYPRPPLKTIESVPLSEILSLTHAELQAKTVQ